MTKKIKKQSTVPKKATSTKVTISPKEYTQTLANLKQQIQEAQVKAIVSANEELIKLYWSIGNTISEKQETHGWGTNAIEKLAKDLQDLCPGIGGFSRANVFRMQAFYLAYAKVAQAVRLFDELPFFKIPWGHNIVLLQKLKDDKDRLWYAQKAIEHGWSRAVLEMQIESKLHNRTGKAITNFQRTLPTPHSDMAQQSLKDPYIFNFLTLQEGYVEQEVEQGLIDNIQKLLLELGKGFSFLGRQYHLEVGRKDYYIDLLFYHTKLRCYVVVELKNTDFEPEYAGKLNFYLSAVDDILRHPDDKPTIGLLLCKTKDNFTAEYALRDINKPIGVAEYTTALVEKLPKQFKSSLPTIKEIEAELEKQEVLSSGLKAKKKL